MRRRTLFRLFALPVTLTLAACEDKLAIRAEEQRSKLIGTWLRQIDKGEHQGRRVLVLRADGQFDETLVITFADGRRGRTTSAGEWTADGTNLKRHYTQEDGRPIGGNFTFATYALTTLDEHQFIGRNHAQGEEIHYQRVPDGTLP